MSTEAAQQADKLFQQAMALHQGGRLEEARNGYLGVVQARPQHSMAWNMLGAVALLLEQPLDALECLDKSLAIDPGNAVAHINRGTAQSQLARYEDAVSSFDRAIELRSAGDAMALYSRGNALLQLKRYADAVESYDKALALKSNYDAEAYYGRGV